MPRPAVASDRGQVSARRRASPAVARPRCQTGQPGAASLPWCAECGSAPGVHASFPRIPGSSPVSRRPCGGGLETAETPKPGKTVCLPLDGQPGEVLQMVAGVLASTCHVRHHKGGIMPLPPPGVRTRPAAPADIPLWGSHREPVSSDPCYLSATAPVLSPVFSIA